MSSDIVKEAKHLLDPLVEGEVRFSVIDRVLYSTDASNFQVIPMGVVIPKSVEDVVRVVEVSKKLGISVLPRGGGTGLVGQCLGYGVVLDFSKYMNRIIDIDSSSKTVKVQPGIYLERLNYSLSKYGLMFGPDPSTAKVATMGGVIANNATGAHSILYGMAGDHIVSVNCVASDGSTFQLSSQMEASAFGMGDKIYRGLQDIARTKGSLIKEKFPKLWRRASGYSLNYLIEDMFNPAKLMASSEGTLAVMTELELKLVDVPKKKGIVILQFEYFLEAIEAVPKIIESFPSAVELIDKMMVELTKEHRGYSQYASFVKGVPEAILVVEFYGNSEKEIELRLDAFIDVVISRGWRCNKDKVLEPKQQQRVWSLRKAALGLLMSRKSRCKPIPCIEDVAVSVELLSGYVEDLLDVLNRLDLRATFYGHASAGCLHIRPFIDLKSSRGVDVMFELQQEVLNIVLKYGGVLSGEHGDGLQRSYLNELLFGHDLYQVMREVKLLFDPDNIMNPGKVVDGVSPSDNLKNLLRYKEESPVSEFKTYLFWGEEKGLLEATEMCNGQGLCRKLEEGIMCPSFRVTRDEKDTTRARANTLRAILSGVISPNFLTKDDVYEVFDLCIGCKSCGKECPSSVDVSKMKTEYIAQYKHKKGFDIRDRLFGYIHEISSIVSYIPRVVNKAGDIPFMDRWLEMLGISKERRLPRYAPRRFSHWFRSRSKSFSSERGKRIVYFHDTWTEYFYPQIGKAAVEFLEALGFCVEIVTNRQCCGRPLISRGMIEDAKKRALANLSVFRPYMEKGIPIVGTEASCISTFKDDYMSLVPGKEVEAFAENCYMVDEFVSDAVRSGEVEVNFDPPNRLILWHIHCHQRSLMNPDSTLLFLKANGFSVEESGVTCCGMAGSFGYEKEHYKISELIGKAGILPKLQELKEDSIVCISGVSCMQQVEHLASRNTLHVIELMNSHLIRNVK